MSNDEVAPPEATDPHQTSKAKDALFADPPRVEATPNVPPVEEEPEQPQHGGFDVKFKAATEDDADYAAEEQNPKEQSQ